ncbi:MAG: type II secretion system protein [Deltaproteobacteria bacterium]|nr:type II secretion system protein [Deltaproteobacteria bacterium]
MMSRRGATLIEVMVAVVVLAIGSVAAMDLATQVVRANEQLNFQTASYEVFNRVAAEIRSATCHVYPGLVAPAPGTADAGLLVPAGAWQSAQAGTSVIRSIGDIEHGAATDGTGMPMIVDYRVQPDPPANPGELFGFDIEVRVREAKFNVAQDTLNATSTHWIRTWPIRKNCVVRSEAASRGGWQ